MVLIIAKLTMFNTLALLPADMIALSIFYHIMSVLCYCCLMREVYLCSRIDGASFPFLSLNRNIAQKGGWLSAREP